MTDGNEAGMERLAVAQALYQELGKVVATRPRTGDSLRSQADDALREAWERDGVSQLRPRVNGVPVGTYTVQLTKPVERVALVVRDRQALMDWLLGDEGVPYLLRLADAHMPELLDGIKSEGEVPPGCETRGVVEPARYKGTRLVVDAEKVRQALGDRLPEAAVALLGDGAE